MADSASDLASIIQESNIVQVNYIAATTLFCYDYCLTAGREVHLVWRRGFSTSTVLFFGVRYPAVFSTIFVVMDMTSWKGMSSLTKSLPSQSCGILIHIDMALNIILLTSAAVFSGLRVYALWDRNMWILVAVLLLGMVNPAISIYTFTRMEPVNYTFPSLACGFNSTISNTDYENWMIGGRLSSVLADVLVLIATWTRTWPMRVEASKINFTARFAAILMRDGTLYFVVLLVANLIGLGLARRIELIEPMSTWIALVTAIFTSRFIIDLHEAADTLSREDTTQLTEFGTLETIAFHVDSRLAHTQHGSSASRSVYGAVLTDLSMTTEWNDSDESQGPPDMPKDKPSFEMELVGVAV